MICQPKERGTNQEPQESVPQKLFPIKKSSDVTATYPYKEPDAELNWQ